MQQKLFIKHFLVFLSITIIFYWVLIIENFATGKNSAVCKNISSGWTVVYKGNEYKNIDLREFKFKNTKRGDVISLSRKLSLKSMEFPSLRFFLIYSALKVFSNGKKIYSYNVENYKNKKWLGAGYIDVPLDTISPQSDITLEIIIGQNRVFSVPDDIFIDNYGRSFINFIKGKIFILICTFFLIMTGLIGIIVFFFLSSVHENSLVLFQIFLLSLVIGTGSLGNAGFIGLYTGNNVLGSTIEYTSFYLIPLIMFFMIPRFIMVSRIERSILKVFKYVYGLFLIIVAVLHVTKIVYISETLFMYHILCGVGFIFAVFLIIDKFRQEENKDAIAVLSLCLMFILFFLDLIRNVLTRYDFVKAFVPSFSTLSLNGVIFIISALWGYIYRVSDYKKQTDKTNANTKDVDYLTGCSTRDSTFHYLDNINNAFKENSECFYAVITFYLQDYDELQKRFGLSKAEQILIDFSNEIKRIFSYYGKVGRIGTSRFIVVAPSILKAKTKVLINVFDKSINKYCKINELILKYSSSLAFNYELDTMLETGAMEVYQLSETRLHSIDFNTDPKK